MVRRCITCEAAQREGEQFLFSIRSWIVHIIFLSLLSCAYWAKLFWRRRNFKIPRHEVLEPSKSDGFAKYITDQAATYVQSRPKCRPIDDFFSSSGTFCDGIVQNVQAKHGASICIFSLIWLSEGIKIS